MESFNKKCARVIGKELETTLKVINKNSKQMGAFGVLLN